MNAPDFATWASVRGVPYSTTEELIEYAATPEEMKEAFDAVEPPPPVYPLGDIVQMTDEDYYKISARENGFIIVGGCVNGDLIAIDVADDTGSVWYICHETMHGKPVREVSVRVAADLMEFFAGMVEDTFPLDYFDAVDRERTAGE